MLSLRRGVRRVRAGSVLIVLCSLLAGCLGSNTPTETETNLHKLAILYGRYIALANKQDGVVVNDSDL